MSAQKLKVGEKVRVYNAPLGEQNAEVVVVNDEKKNPGKVIGVKLDRFVPVAHSCEGECEAGYGWWTRPEQIAVL